MSVIALAKGRLLQDSLGVLDQVGIRFGPEIDDSRRLVCSSRDGEHQIVQLKPIDIPTYVEYGVADLGIVGLDTLREAGADVLQPLDLNFGHCKIVVAGHQQNETSVGPDASTIRVATKYPRISLEYYTARGIPVEIIRLSGSIELAPLIGLADRVVDLVETGRTLKENGLEILDVIAESSARLIVNRAAYQTKRNEINGLIRSLRQLVSVTQNV